MNLWGTHLSLLPQNRFTLQDQNSEKPATKLWEGNVPLCVDDNVIETALKNLGCEMRSTVRKELARDKNGKLTNWEMGRLYYCSHNTTPKDVYNGHILGGTVPQGNEGDARREQKEMR